jgi:hypothetical protein
MLAIHAGTGPSRRELLRAGGLSWLGLGLTDLPQVDAGARPPGRLRFRSCVFVFLFGGPSHIDLWDMKPAAPAEIRGEFKPVATSVPGIHVCEHLPRLAARMKHLCLVRSMTHRMPVHGPACSEVYSGRPYFGPPITDQAKPEDWPSLAALVMRYGRPANRLPPSVVLPWYTQFVGQDRRIAGQTGGRMGEAHNPVLIDGDPARADFAVPGFDLRADLAPARLDERRRLLGRLESSRAGEALPARRLARQAGMAYATLAQPAFRRALDLRQAPAARRERYGRTRFGQSLLLAARLVEAGVPLVTVNWDDETRFDKVSPHWDTHHDNFRRLREVLCPPFDRAFSAFLDDLDDRGLLDSTLVVALGEFGRTPRIGQFTQNNMTKATGRDHWPWAFTALLAGGGIRGGQAYGRTTGNGGYVADRPVSPADLAATVLVGLGIDPRQHYRDHFQQVEQQVCEGRPIADLG